MLLRDLTRVWISEYEAINNHGEPEKKWKIKKEELTVKEANEATIKKLNRMLVSKLTSTNKENTIWLNLQQDINELDRKPTGEVDYSIENARTDRDYNIQKGNGISLTDISNKEDFVPNYTVTDKIRIGSTTLYKLEKYNGN